MGKAKKIKLFIGLFYVSAVCLFLYFLFSKFSIQEITSYEFIKNNRDYFFNIKQSNLYLISILFFLFSILWVLLAGFLSPLAILAGFIFGKWLGSLLVIFGCAIGATGLYIFANYYLKELIREKFLNRFQKLAVKFQKSEFIYLLIYRFIGGIPFVISNVLPCIFNVKPFNFFLATLIGVTPQIFLVVSIGSGIERIIKQNSLPPKISEIIFSADIYLPLLGFILLVVITLFLKKLFYKT